MALAFLFLFLGAVRTNLGFTLRVSKSENTEGSLRDCIANASSGDFVLLQRECSGPETENCCPGLGPLACLKDVTLGCCYLSGRPRFFSHVPTLEVTAAFQRPFEFLSDYSRAVYVLASHKAGQAVYIYESVQEFCSLKKF